jgi:Fe-S cluster assembly protein SufD
LAPAPDGGAPASGFAEVVVDPAAVVRTRDGIVIEITIYRQAGLQIRRLCELDGPVGAALAAELDEPFVDLADALLVDGVVISVGAHQEIEGPIVVVHEFSGAATPVVRSARTVVEIGEGGAATVLEHLISGAGELLVLPVTEIDVASSATLIYQIVQELDVSSWSFGYQVSRVADSGSLRSFAAALGGGYARLLTRSSLVGELASSELLAASLGTGSQVQHFVTAQEHLAPRTRSELIFKGAVADAAESIYIGLVHMAKGARKSEASQTNRNLVLGSDANASSVPNLDIEENDVKCAHASAVGPIDPEQRFYLQARGIHPEVAERLILLGFFNDLLDRVVERGSAAHVRAAVARALVGETSEVAV